MKAILLESHGGPEALRPAERRYTPSRTATS